LSTVKKKNTFLLRKILIAALIASFAYVMSIFIYQYFEQQKVKDRLNTAYGALNQRSSGLYGLFSVYSEADNLFRLYTVNFDKKTYGAYRSKLDTVKLFVDSLSKLTLSDHSLEVSAADVAHKRRLSTEFASLKQTVDQLIFFTNDSLSTLSSDTKTTSYREPKFEQLDSIVNRIMRDSSFNTLKRDTTIRKKEKLFNRIFKAKNDTLVASTITQDYGTIQRDVISRNIEYLIRQNKKIYHQNLRALQGKFSALQDKEKELIQANRDLLDNLRKGIDKIRDQETFEIRQAEAKDLALYQENTLNFRDQLVASFIIILLLIIITFFYQSNAVSYERKLQEERDYADKVAAEKTTILASVSHEVRSPINSLLGIIDILRKNNDSKLILPEYLDSASHEIEVINTAVNDILNLSKLEAGALEVQYEYFAPQQLLLDIIKLHEHLAAVKDIKLVSKIDIDPTLLIYSSAFRVKQIVSNLLNNAIKYTARGEVYIAASLKSKHDQSVFSVEVKDSGVGISEEEQGLVFRQYYMAGNKNQSSSFGLGLYISKLFAQQLDGTIDLVSILEQGSTFTLSVPIKQIKKIDSEQQKYVLDDLPDLNMVVIEDNRINILYLKNYFKNFPKVHIFEKGEAALAYMEEQPVDIVITDLHMNDLDGWEILNRVRSNPAWKNIRVFVFTADSMYMEVEQQKHQIYFDAKLKKPMDAHDLISRIKEVK